MKFLIVVDMQNDFITGSLGSDMAKAIIPKVEEKIKNFDGQIIFTKDTHQKDYLKTQEGINLPVKHCIFQTDGWEICPELENYSKTSCCIFKKGFGSIELPELIKDILLDENNKKENLEEIELCGLCTDICVISNAMILKAAFPEIKITVDSSCCAGVTEENHNNAIKAMKSVQINII